MAVGKTLAAILNKKFQKSLEPHSVRGMAKSPPTLSWHWTAVQTTRKQKLVRTIELGRRSVTFQNTKQANAAENDRTGMENRAP